MAFRSKILYRSGIFHTTGKSIYYVLDISCDFVYLYAVSGNSIFIEHICEALDSML